MIGDGFLHHHHYHHHCRACCCTKVCTVYHHHLTTTTMCALLLCAQSLTRGMLLRYLSRIPRIVSHLLKRDVMQWYVLNMHVCDVSPSAMVNENAQALRKVFIGACMQSSVPSARYIAYENIFCSDFELRYILSTFKYI